MARLMHVKYANFVFASLEGMHPPREEGAVQAARPYARAYLSTLSYQASGRSHGRTAEEKNGTENH